MFNLPLDTITIQDIEQFLQSGARENTVFELKEQFPNKLEKFIASMANTSGGMILIGVEETKTGGGAVPVKGIPLESGLRERVVQIGLNAIYPPVIPEVRVTEFKSDPALTEPDRAVVVIRVHESDEGHAVDHRTAVYLRRDNVSDRVERATVEEIEWFHQKRQKSLAEKRRIIQQAQQHAEQFLLRLRNRHLRSTSEPKGKFVIWTVPTFPRSPIATPKELYEATGKQIRHTPSIAPVSFPYGVPHRLFEGIYWGHDESKNYYYTEIQQQGLVYSEFEFWWDDENADMFIPGAAASLLSAAAEFGRTLYHHFGYLGLFDLGIRLVGIRNRYVHPTFSSRPRIMDDVIEITARIAVGVSEDELLLKCKQIVREIYWAFGWHVDDNRIDHDFK